MNCEALSLLDVCAVGRLTGLRVFPRGTLNIALSFCRNNINCLLRCTNYGRFIVHPMDPFCVCVWKISYLSVQLFCHFSLAIIYFFFGCCIPRQKLNVHLFSTPDVILFNVSFEFKVFPISIQSIWHLPTKHFNSKALLYLFHSFFLRYNWAKSFLTLLAQPDPWDIRVNRYEWVSYACCEGSNSSPSLAPQK